jgi:serine/threonine-protein kinase
MAETTIRVPRDAPAGLPAGTRLSDNTYELEKVVAAGGMGEVYRGRLVETGDPVAIKMIKPEFAGDEAILALFRKEAAALFSLSHDAIVRYFIFSVDRRLERPYLAMEFVDGPSLKDRVRREALTFDEINTLRRRVAAGLQAAHDKGIIHRDISPDNFILPGGAIAKAKIIDFGIARTEDSRHGTLIGNNFAGKLSYASPEQLGMFGGKVTNRSDIYSLGLVFAAAARGRPLDMSGNDAEVLEKRSTVPDLTGIDRRLRPLLSRMLQPDPKNRFVSMAEVAAWEPSSVASIVDAGRTAWRPASAVLVLLAVLAGAAWGGYGLYKRHAEDGRPEAAEARKRTDTETTAQRASRAAEALRRTEAEAATTRAAAEAEARRQAETDAAAKRAAEAAAKRDAEAAEARRKAESEAAAKRAAEEAEARRMAEAEAAAKRAAEAAEARRKIEAEAAARRVAEAEEARRKIEAEAAAKRAVAEAEAQRKMEAEALARRAATEAAALRKAEAEAAAKRAAEEAEARRKLEAEATAKRAAEAAEARRMMEAEAAAKRAADAEEARRKLEADAAAKRAAAEAAALRKAEAEAAARRAAEEAEARRKADAEAAAKRAADAADARRIVEAEAAAKRAADAEEARRKLEADAAVKRAAAEAEAQRKAEAAAAAKRVAEEAEARRKLEAERAAEEAQALRLAEGAEAALQLALADRQRLQVALTSLGFDTRGVDGAFGPRSRQMIADWQKSKTYPATGFLTAPQQQQLLLEAATAVARHDDDMRKADEERKRIEAARRAAPAVAAPAATPAPAPARPPAPRIESSGGGVVCQDSTGRRIDESAVSPPGCNASEPQDRSAA